MAPNTVSAAACRLPYRFSLQAESDRLSGIQSDFFVDRSQHLEPNEADRPAVSSDPVVHHLRPCLQTARSRPSEMCSNCLDHLETALRAYLRSHKVSPPVTRGGLAPWQLRRATEIMGSSLEEGVPTADLARACNLSPGHFVRAFKQTTGQPPRRWLMGRRIEKAKQLLSDTTLSLVEIATACGFADQSHFTRVFSRTTRTSPGAWRRYLRNDPSLQGPLLRAHEAPVRGGKPHATTMPPSVTLEACVLTGS
jgi:AraC-like DNA-binding protein